MFIPVEFLIFTFCLVGCGLTCYFLGHRAGIEGTVEYLIDAGVLTAEEIEDEE